MSLGSFGPVRSTSLALMLLLAPVALAAPACADRDKEAPAAAAPAGASPVGASQATPVGAAQSSESTRAPATSRALRITTETTLASTDVQSSVAALRKAIGDAGGYISDARTGGSGENKTADLEAKIPADKLASFRASLGEHGEIVSDTEKAEDVTEQRADLKARLRNARTQEKRLLDLLSDRTGNLADVIAAEKALAEIRDVVERLEAQDLVLEGQIAFATVKLKVLPKTELVASSAGDKIARAGAEGIEICGKFFVAMAVIGVTAGPTVLVLLAIALAALFLWRRLARRFGWSIKRRAVS